ncbi:MAG TPA: DinB family protein [Flavipsychrobacter sp.]|nr:DinB family protein [Flavipsychrobacter sp.]
MKEILLQFAKYNAWANKRIIDVLLKIDEDELDKEVISSFPTLRKTIYHMWTAEFIWLQRLQLTEQPVWIEDIFKGNFEEACADWQRVSQTIAQFIEKQYDDRSFEHICEYYDKQKRPNKLPISIILSQLFSHSTYHRGQLVTMMHQVSITKIPPTDFLIFLAAKS